MPVQAFSIFIFSCLPERNIGVRIDQLLYPKYDLFALRERGGVVVERRTPDREALGSIPTGVIVLCP